MPFSKQHWIILIIMITEVLGFSLILPFLPFYARDLGASAFTIGLLGTSFSLFQFISAPIMGNLSDYYGRKPLLIISQFSTALGFLFLAFSHNIWMLFASRIVDGLLGSNGTIAQAYLSDISSKKDRSKAFGTSGIAFGFGFMVGPAIGGWLSQFGFSIPALVACGMSLLSIILTYFYLPETIKVKPKNFKLEAKILPINKLKKYFTNKNVQQQLTEFSLYVIGHAIFASNFSLYASHALDITPQQIGFGLGYIGFVSIIFRGFLLPKLIDHFPERILEKIALFFAFFALIGSSFVTNWPMIFVFLTFYAAGSGSLRPLMMGDISRSVDEKEQGALMGVTSSLNSIAQIIGPLTGGIILNNFLPQSMLWLAAGLIAGTSILVFKEKKFY